MADNDGIPITIEFTSVTLVCERVEANTPQRRTGAPFCQPEEVFSFRAGEGRVGCTSECRFPRTISLRQPDEGSSKGNVRSGRQCVGKID
jgi:hypothetical protein